LTLAFVVVAACKSSSPPPGGWDSNDRTGGAGDQGAGRGLERHELEVGGIGEGGLLRRKGGLIAARPAARSAAPQIDCDKAIPSGLLARYLPEATPQWGEPFDNGEGSMVTSCRLVDHGLKGGTIIRYKCGNAFSTESHGELPCVIEIDELGEGQLADRAAFVADLQAALTRDAVR
jgi:hypothetical protein